MPNRKNATKDVAYPPLGIVSPLFTQKRGFGKLRFGRFKLPYQLAYDIAPL